MKSAYLIGEHAEDLEVVGRAWRAQAGVETAPGVIQWFDSGYLFNVFTETSEFQERDWREGWAESALADPPPETGLAWYIECRSEDVFARILREASSLVPGRLWVLDSNDVIWPADAIDPKRIVL